MKVIVLSQALHPQYGGSAVSEASLCAQLQQRCETVVLCRAGAYDDAFGRSFGLTHVREVTPLEVFRAWIQPSHPLHALLDGVDLVHLNGHWCWEWIAFTRLAHRRGIPFLMHPRGMLWLGHRKVWLKRIFNFVLGRWAITHASRVIALSAFEKQQWTPYALAEPRCVVIPNGVTACAESPGERPYALPYFLYLGRIESRKNLVFLVRAFHRYVRTGGNADLLLIGPAERGYDVRVADEIDRLGLRGRARLLAPEYGDRKQAYLRHALAVVYPSVGEPFGRVPFETLAAGGMPLVPRESGSAEYLESFLPESIYPMQDHDALAARFRALEGLDRRNLSGWVAARGWVAKDLDWTKITDQVEAVYKGVVAEAHA